MSYFTLHFLQCSVQFNIRYFEHYWSCEFDPLAIQTALAWAIPEDQYPPYEMSRNGSLTATGLQQSSPVWDLYTAAGWIAALLGLINMLLFVPLCYKVLTLVPRFSNGIQLTFMYCICPLYMDQIFYNLSCLFDHHHNSCSTTVQKNLFRWLTTVKLLSFLQALSVTPFFHSSLLVCKSHVWDPCLFPDLFFFFSGGAWVHSSRHFEDYCKS